MSFIYEVLTDTPQRVSIDDVNPDMLDIPMNKPNPLDECKLSDDELYQSIEQDQHLLDEYENEKDRIQRARRLLFSSNNLCELDALVRAIGDSKKQLFSQSYTLNLRRHLVIQSHHAKIQFPNLHYEVSRFLSEAFEFHLVTVEQAGSTISYHPSSQGYIFSDYVNIIHQLLQNPLYQALFMPTGTPPSADFGGLVVGRLNEFIADIRAALQSPAFKLKVKQRNALPRARIKRMRTTVNRLFERYGKLLVLRIDFAFKGLWINGSLQENLVGLEIAKQTMGRFIANQRHNKLFETLVGYMIKLEYGDLKGFHFHCVFFFNGDAVQSDTYYAMQIGKYWKSLTEERGLFYSCNHKKSEYRHLAIGKIRYTDTQMRETFDTMVLPYLAKHDQYLHVKLSKATNLLQMAGAQRILGLKRGRRRNTPTQLDEVLLTDSIGDAGLLDRL
jgi:hypothetical protein